METNNRMDSASGQFTNYYKLLGIDAKADHQTIKQAYLAKIKEWHPDKNPERADEAEEKTKVLNQAFGILGDPEQRRHYDRMLHFTEGLDYTEYVNDKAIRDKIHKASPSIIAVLKNVIVLYALFKDTLSGNFRIPPDSIAMIGGGLLYFLLSVDLIPDLLASIGYLDDLAVLTTIANHLKKEVREYRIWKEK